MTEVQFKTIQEPCKFKQTWNVNTEKIMRCHFGLEVCKKENCPLFPVINIIIGALKNG